MNINLNNLIKYLILFSIVTFSTFFIPGCSIMNQHAVYIGLLAGTTYVLLDKYYPSIVINKEEQISYRVLRWKNMSQLERLAYAKKSKNWRDNTEGGKKFKKRTSEQSKVSYYERKNDPVAHKLHLEKQRIYENKQRKNNPQFRFKQNLSRRIRGAITKLKTKKNISTLELTGINNIQSLMHYIAKQFKCDLKGKPMTWDNYGEWHIDHIKPCISFDLTCPIQQKKCFHYTNLQPLWAIDNLKKHAKLNYENK